MQIAEQEILRVVASLVVQLRRMLLFHSYTMLPMYSSQWSSVAILAVFLLDLASFSHC